MKKTLTFLAFISIAMIFTVSCNNDEPTLNTTAPTGTVDTAVTGAPGADITISGTLADTQGLTGVTAVNTTLGLNASEQLDNLTTYQLNLTFLLDATTTPDDYTVVVTATNNANLSTSFDVVVTVAYEGSITDIDGNIYHIITIGSQVWMVENLKTTKYRNGDPIPNVIGEQWDNITSGAYCSYDNNEDNRTTYGLLYNWYAASDNRNICPEGWHIPTLDELQTLTSTGLGLKEPGSAHWMSPNICKPNSSGFNALPGGNCGYDGNFNAISEMGYWWTADEYDAGNAWLSLMSNNGPGFAGSFNMDKWGGGSIRCIKD